MELYRRPTECKYVLTRRRSKVHINYLAECAISQQLSLTPVFKKPRNNNCTVRKAHMQTSANASLLVLYDSKVYLHCAVARSRRRVILLCIVECVCCGFRISLSCLHALCSTVPALSHSTLAFFVP